MNALANAIVNKSTTTRTENGDKTYSTTLAPVLDLFFRIAAIRSQPTTVATSLYDTAAGVDEDMATRVLLWARDIRSGAGERKVFRDIIRHMEKNYPDRLARILPLIPEVGRWDDLFVFETGYFRKLASEMMAKAILSGNGLAAKWAPRENSAKKSFYNEIRTAMNLTPREYRKLVASNSKTVEQQMCAGNWEEINFSQVPSVASARYSKAFWKRQADRYGEFVNKAKNGEVKINASAIFPYDVLKSTVDSATADALWANLPDYVPANTSFMTIIDTSGSMGVQVSPGISAMNVAISIGMYLAQRNKSAFKNLAMTFNSVPEWIRIPDTKTGIQQIARDIQRAPWGSTNLDAAMQLIVTTAKQNRVSADDIPDYLLVISDMEFNAGGYYIGDTSVSERTEKMFRDAGYKRPNIVWWNVNSRGSIPVRFDEKGNALVSGCSPVIAKTVLSGEADPMKVMLRTVGIERYDH